MLIQVIVDGAARGQGNPSINPYLCEQCNESEAAGDVFYGEGAIGVVICRNADVRNLTPDKVIGRYARALGRVTNNQAEYEAVLAGLMMCWSASLYDPIIYSDSALVVNQINRKWRCEAPSIRPLLLSIWDLQERFRFRIVHVPRREVHWADTLANQMLDLVEADRRKD